MEKPDADLAPIFLESYRACRAAFLDGARQAGAAVRSRVHPALKGLDGEDLAVDAALVGPPEARRLLVMHSGTHGYEGFAGSALQLDFLRTLPESLEATSDVAILLVHGVNPYGWSHFSRTNENNVDLNRNFIDFAAPPREHSLAGDIQDLNTLCSRAGPDFQNLIGRLMVLAKAYGRESIGDALQRGQYFKPDGVGYGGAEQEWSNQILSELWAEDFQRRDLVAIVDWHTGLGAYGDPVFLCFDPPGAPGHDLAVSWWGADALAAADAAYESGTRPDYSGLMAVAAGDAARAAGAVALSAVIEFGTQTPMEAAQCLWIDRWLRHAPADADPASVETLHLRARKFFYPDDDDWKQAVLCEGRRIIAQALRGLRGWSTTACDAASATCHRTAQEGRPL